MRQRLKSVLAMLDNDSVKELINHFLSIKHHRISFNTLMVAMFDANERRLDCYFQPEDKRYAPIRLNTDIEDINHPLVQVLRSGVPQTWDSLNQGVRIEDNAFRHLVEKQPMGCGLYAAPLFDLRGQACGVIAVFTADTASFADTKGIFGVYCHVFQHRLIKLQEIAQLKSQLTQIRELLKSQQQHKKQLDELLVSMSESDGRTLPGLSYDYSKIDDLNKALESFEQAILLHRKRLYGEDKNRIARSLCISPRTLAYKLEKYRC
jgi:hypothetical protein